MLKPSHQSPGPEAAVFRSLGLAALLQHLEEGRLYSVLDLGPARGGNLDFWAPVACRICFEDFYRTWAGAGFLKPEEGASHVPLLRKLLSFDESARFDIVLAWDLFNYLEPGQIEALVEYIARSCRTGAILMAMISSAPVIPELPTVFRIRDREHLAYESGTAAMRPGPRYQARDIARMVPGFQVLNSFLLRHGVQEYLFLYQGDTVPKPNRNG
jgi:hypothetical protein